MVQTYTFSPADFHLEWQARKVVGAHHTGSIQLARGTVTIDDAATPVTIVEAVFVCDMTTIGETQMKNETMRAQLEKHLHSEDFFDVANFPQSVLSVSVATPRPDRGADAYDFAGVLTIKGISNPVTVPATVQRNTDNLVVHATFTFDRSLWDIRYGSGKFFQNLGDELIKDEIEVSVRASGRLDVS